MDWLTNWLADGDCRKWREQAAREARAAREERAVRALEKIAAAAQRPMKLIGENL